MLIEVLCSEWDQYELVDCGDRRKLERFGEVLVVRGEPRAWWRVQPAWYPAPMRIRPVRQMRKTMKRSPP